MEHMYKIYSVAFCLLFFFAKAHVKEIQSISECLHEIYVERQGYKSEDILVVFDIDNTLIRPQTSLGSDQWFDYMMKENQAKGHDLPTAVALVLPKLFYIYHKTTMSIVEEATREVVCDLQKGNFNCICLTARSPYLAEITCERLSHLGMEFSFKGIAQDTVLNISPLVLYHHGIIFCGVMGKDITLLQFLDSTGYLPKKIIMIDDKEKILHAVEESVKSRAIEFLGLRYAYCDDSITAYDHAVAEKEWETLRKISLI